MIQDIPTDGEFFETGQSLLDVAWSTVVELLDAFHAGQYEGQGDEFEDYQADFWNASQTRLRTSLTIMQQGVEFILKGRIAGVSSFLLLSDPPDK